MFSLHALPWTQSIAHLIEDSVLRGALNGSSFYPGSGCRATCSTAPRWNGGACLKSTLVVVPDLPLFSLIKVCHVRQPLCCCQDAWNQLWAHMPGCRSSGTQLYNRRTLYRVQTCSKVTKERSLYYAVHVRVCTGSYDIRVWDSPIYIYTHVCIDPAGCV